MEDIAKLTGDVIDSRFVSPDGDLYFLMEDSVHRFVISLKEILECLKYAEEHYEIPEIPQSVWASAYDRYPDMYKGEHYNGQI